MTSDDTTRITRLAAPAGGRHRRSDETEDDPGEYLAWLARRLRRHPINGVGYDAEGVPHQVHVPEAALAWPILQGGGFGLTSLTEIGAAADALRAGDRAPLLRLAAESDISSPFTGDSGDPTAFSAGDNFARYCTDNRFPWDKSASVPTRRAQWQQARDALSPDHFGLFSVDGWVDRPLSPFAPDPCIVWPAPRYPALYAPTKLYAAAI